MIERLGDAPLEDGYREKMVALACVLDEFFNGEFKGDAERADQALRRLAGNAGARMIESEFRDWTRGQLRALDERIKAVAALKGEPVKRRVEKRIHDTIVNLGEKLIEEAKAGRVLAAGIVYVNDQHGTMTGWSADGGYFELAGAASFMGLQILEEFRNAELANDQPSGDAPAGGATAQG